MGKLARPVLTRAPRRKYFQLLPTQPMSASSKHWLVSERVLGDDVDLLQKPFKLADLLNRVERVVAR